MSKQTEKALVPELRFPEFRDSGEWESGKIGDFISSHKGGASLSPKDFLDSSEYEVIPKKSICDGGWLKIQPKELTCCTKDFFDNNRQAVIDSSYLVTTLRDLVPSGPNIGYIVKFQGKKQYLLAQGVYGLKPKKHYCSDFLIHYSNTYIYRGLVNSVMVGSTQVHIRNGVFLNLFVNIPKFDEQQKIADCLSSIDELITAHTQKHEVLKAHKKGLMQQLFPAVGETVPKLRFPEFPDAGEWKEAKLDEITGFSSGGTPSKRVPEYWEGETPWISAASMHDTRINFSNKNITKLAIQDGARTVPKGTLLLLVRGSMLHKRIPVGITENKVSFNQDVKALTLRINIVERFLLYLLLASEWRLLSSVTKTGIGAGKLDTADLKDFLVHIPTDKDEQQKIADCLSSIDDLITAQTQKTELLKVYKKGLMQQIFPAEIRR